MGMKEREHLENANRENEPIWLPFIPAAAPTPRQSPRSTKAQWGPGLEISELLVTPVTALTLALMTAVTTVTLA